MRVICDTNVIIDLFKIGRLCLLSDLFQEVVIPLEVEHELLAGKTPEEEIRKALHEWIKVEKIKDALALEGLKTQLGNGEAAGIVLYLETESDLLALNDLKARGIAQALGVRVIGTLGILRFAKNRGLVGLIKPMLDELIKTGAYRLSGNSRGRNCICKSSK